MKVTNKPKKEGRLSCLSTSLPHMGWRTRSKRVFFDFYVCIYFEYDFEN